MWHKQPPPNLSEWSVERGTELFAGIQTKLERPLSLQQYRFSTPQGCAIKEACKWMTHFFVQNLTEADEIFGFAERF